MRVRERPCIQPHRVAAPPASFAPRPLLRPDLPGKSPRPFSSGQGKIPRYAPFVRKLIKVRLPRKWRCCNRLWQVWQGMALALPLLLAVQRIGLARSGRDPEPQEEIVMRKLWQSLAGTSFAVALALGTVASAGAQEIPVPTDPEVEIPEAEAEAVQEQEPVTVTLSAVGAGTGSGQATLSPGLSGQAEAVIEVEGFEPGTQWSAFLIEGTCEAPGNVVAPLGTIDVADAGSGRGEVALTAALADLTAGEATVQIHPQGDAPSEASLCGALPAAGGAGALPF